MCISDSNLAALAALPHVGSVISTDDEGYEEGVAQLFRDIGEIVGRRKEKLAAANLTALHDYNRLHPDDPQPALVIVIDNFVEFRETFDKGNDEIEDVFDQFVDLARRARPYGVHFVVTAHTSGAIPQQVFNLFSERLVLRLNDPSEYRAIVPGAPEPLPPLAAAVVVAAYRIASEALTNAVRHAGASQARVRLRHETVVLVLEIEDDGLGIAEDRTPGVGLISMRERATELGGLALGQRDAHGFVSQPRQAQATEGRLAPEPIAGQPDRVARDQPASPG